MKKLDFYKPSFKPVGLNEIKKLIPNSFGIFYTKAPDGIDYGCTFSWPKTIKEFKEMMNFIVLTMNDHHAEKWYKEKEKHLTK